MPETSGFPSRHPRRVLGFSSNGSAKGAKLTLAFESLSGEPNKVYGQLIECCWKHILLILSHLNDAVFIAPYRRLDSFP
jgi:hypothetical protein